jgi:hypothetical protein
MTYVVDRPPQTAAEFRLPIWLALLVYQSQSAVRRNLQQAAFNAKSVTFFGHEGPVSLRTDSMKGFLVQGPKGRFLVLRGSDGPFDWAQNLRYELSASGELLGGGAGHSGFLETLAVHSPPLLEEIAGYKGPGHQLPLWVVGHSLGGAQASLFGYFAAAKGIPVGAVVTFGQPRVANRKLAEQIDSVLGERLVRLVRPEDPITHLPPSRSAAEDAAAIFARLPGARSQEVLSELFRDMDYSHAGQEFELVTQNQIQQGNGLVDLRDQKFFAILRQNVLGDITPGLSIFEKFRLSLGSILSHRPEGMLCDLKDSL